MQFVWALPLCCVLVSMSFAQTEPADPSPDAVFSATRDRLVADISRQPRYTCAQNLTREFYAPSSKKEKACVEVIAARERRKHEPPLAFWDRLHLDVAIAGDREIHSWSGAIRRLRDILSLDSGDAQTLQILAVENELAAGDLANKRTLPAAEASH